jgi:uridine monophosphate synthetase
MEDKKYLEMDILIQKLKYINAITYGNFTLKSGMKSNYYCDFRILISYPNILKCIYNLIPNNIYEGIDLVCGVFFGGMPLANLISFQKNIPQIFIRDEQKTYGKKKLIEGLYSKGQTVLLIEDVVTTGGSMLEKIKVLEDCGLKVKLLTILNRNSELEMLNGFVLNSILPLHKIINENNLVSNKLYNLAFKKQSNIILSVDLNNSNEIINLIEETKDNIVGIKIHSDIIDDFNNLLEYLKQIKEEFIIIEDCKVADISFISIQKVKNYVNYADYITYHCLLGDDLPISLKKEFNNLSLLGVVEMSVKNSLIDINYINKTENQLNLMDGCVIQKNGLQLFNNKLPITFSPGISLNNKGDNHNQTYKNPLNEKVGEFWIIGRSIYLEKNKKEESKKYKDLGWSYFINFNL